MVKSQGYFGEATETFTRAACAPQIRGIRVVCGCLLFPQLVSIRVDSWLASQKRRQVAALQSASREIRVIRVIRGLPSPPKHSCPFVVSPPKIFLEPRRRDQYKRVNASRLRRR